MNLIFKKIYPVALSLLVNFLVVLLPASSAAQHMNGGIDFFTGRWKDALELAKKENKLLFIDCNAVWCMPCKRLAQEEFSKKEMGDLFNRYFINVDLDMEKEDGKEIARKFQIKYYPALVIANADGYRIQQFDVAGDKKADELISWARAALLKRDTVTLEEKFGKGQRDTAFLRTFFSDLMQKRNASALRSALEDLVKENGNNILLENPCFNIIPMQPIHSDIANFFFENNKLFIKKFGEDRVAAMISRMWNTINLMEEFYSPGPQRIYKPEVYDRFVSDLTSYKIPKADFIKGQVDVFIAVRAGKQDLAYEICAGLTKNAKPWQYHDIAKTANNNLRGKFRLMAAPWAKKAISDNSDSLYRSESERYYHELLHDGYASRNQSDPFEMILRL
ncbi:thioredoxin family protein [Pedobacter frigidisoli]|uniref:thioredoxin family protein n=1 Tax=Pedobacter frigidisoli TaxID=2530455 RepID=UPI0029312C86|nr:thioredoxin family protein [Pedobacter frigidisoli]